MEGLFNNTILGEKFSELKQQRSNQLWFDSISDEKVKEFILFLVQYGQLFSKGINEFGQVIGLYSELTEQIDPTKKHNTPYTFHDTGEFFKSMFVTPLSEGFIIDGDGIKTGKKLRNGEAVDSTIDLFKEYGDEIIGLTEESKEELAVFLVDKFIENVKKIL